MEIKGIIAQVLTAGRVARCGRLVAAADSQAEPWNYAT